MPLPNRASFHPDYPAVQIAWDSTSLTTGMKCWTRYAYSIVLGYRPKSSSIHLEFGSIVHKGLEVYWKDRCIPTANHDECQEHMVRYLMREYAAWKTEDTTKNLYNAIRACVWHTEANQNDPDKTVMLEGVPGIELAFKYDLAIDIAGLHAAYCGHIDRLVEAVTGGYWVKDYKTTAGALDLRYFGGFKPSTQLPGYLVGASIIFDESTPILGVQIDAIQLGVNFSRFAKGHIFLSDSEKDEWMKDAIYKIKEGSQIFLAATVEDGIDLQRIPRNTEACFGCPYRQVCQQPPSLRMMTLESNYAQAFWDPILRKEAE